MTSTGTTEAKQTAPYPTHYRALAMDNQEVFYREAGAPDAPAVVLLHGFPSSSNMFRNLIPKLALTFHVVAPDYIGYGQSSMPDHKQFAYTFENQTRFVERLVNSLGLKKYVLYLMDYGAPIGYRLALRHPEQIAGLIIQNGNAYEGGLLEFWNPIRDYWRDRSPEREAGVAFLVSPNGTRWQYENGVPDTSLLDPTAWLVDQHGLDRPGNGSIQLDMLYDYRTNVPLYPQFQEFLRNYQPPALVVWGKNDLVFPAVGAELYKRDLRDLEIHMLDTGHFALETHCDEIADRIHTFFGRERFIQPGRSF